MHGIGGFLIILIIAVIIGFFVWKFLNKFKMPKLACVNLVTGGVKCGKSTLSVALAYKTYKRNHRQWKIRSWFQSLLHLPVDEEPLLYSNIPLRVPYVPLTIDLLTRKTRFRYKSVLYVCEASLVADNQMYKVAGDTENERVALFNKLFGHSTKNGVCIYDTQCIGDLSINVRRCLSSDIYIYDLIKYFPFFLVAKIREERYSEDGQVINSYNEDVEDSLKKCLISKRTWKLFDAFCYSSFTDDLKVEDRVVTLKKDDSLKAQKVVSFRKYETIPVDRQSEVKENKNA